MPYNGRSTDHYSLYYNLYNNNIIRVYTDILVSYTNKFIEIYHTRKFTNLMIGRYNASYDHADKHLQYYSI